MASRRNLRELNYTVTFYVHASTKTESLVIRGTEVEITDHEENAMFYILDSLKQTVFAMPYRQVCSCIAAGAVRRPRERKARSTSVVPLQRAKA